MKKITALLLVILGATSATAGNLRESISLAGEWHLRYNTQGREVTLPGTTETNGVGDISINPHETTHLSRVRAIEAQVEYSRDVVIPKSWQNKEITLRLERTKPTRVFVDGVEVGTSSNISTSQTFNLTRVLTVGTHHLAIIVDNTRTAVPHQIVENSHAYTDDTQTNWNGIIGDITLTAVNPVHITALTADADSIYVTTSARCNVSLQVNGKYVGTLNVEGSKALAYDSRELERWSEFHPTLHTVRAEIKGKDECEQRFGLCDFKASGTQFSVNGHTTFLRGKHDACVFPKTAHVPMDVAEWSRYLSICKEYGINHIRFHSWCPPEAAFAAADSLGVYLQPELPFWGGFDASNAELMSFLHAEGEHIIREYSHHPSFVMMALGNELWGSIEEMERFVTDFRKINSKILYTFGSNYYLGYKGANPAMDYFTTCRNGGEAWGQYNTHTRGSFSFCDAYDGGIINHFSPNSTMTLEQGIAGCNMPIISHETGQYQTYPDYAEMAKYNGSVLRPYNFEVFKQRLKDAGMLHQAEDFHKASGLWSVQLYKAEIELDMRTRGLGGYQLLDIQDYPGQGSAFVGILDAFMDSKGITTPQEWRQWASPVVPMLATEKFCYANDEHLTGKILLANYTEKSLNGSTMDLYFRRAAARYDITNDTTGLSTVGDIDIDLSSVKKPTKVDLSLDIAGTDYQNSYPIWVYPAKCEPNTSGLVIATQLTDVVAEQLNNGASVLLMPDSTQYADNTVGGLFMTDYWNYRMFKTICENNNKAVSPGTLGILTNPEHAIFKSFPTDMHTSWQWFEIIKHSRPMILDAFGKNYFPTVQVIDNVERNHKLGLIFEFSVGMGKLLVVMSPLKDLQEHIEAKWLYKSVLDYMHSADFNPTTKMSVDELRKALATSAAAQTIDTLNNISY
jgi:hypothetical protein